jgi:hypothetical protein
MVCPNCQNEFKLPTRLLYDFSGTATCPNCETKFKVGVTHAFIWRFIIMSWLCGMLWVGLVLLTGALMFPSLCAGLALLGFYVWLSRGSDSKYRRAFLKR